jgi:NhaP-type Na+/H+ or K+/H+ antiporter
MRLAEIKKHHSMPWRLLLVAVPLMVVLGTGVGVILFGGLSLWVAAVLAVSLAPTDDDLAPYAMDNPGVPVRVRQALNIEGGLEDGILLPLLLAVIALATSTEAGIGEGAVFRFTLGHLAYGVLAGAVMGYLGARYIDLGVKSGWMSSRFQKICWLALVLLTYGAAELIGGNGFIAAFVFGITSGNALSRRDTGGLYDFSETENTLLMLVTYMLLGMVMLPPALKQIDATMVVYALLSLSVVRMLPVAISMIGANLKPESVLFLGWFGPRGIPSILYIFTILGADQTAVRDKILYTAMVTIFFSIILHGLSAAPLSNWYAKRIATYDTADLTRAEKKAAPELPLRNGVTSVQTTAAGPGDG